MTEPLLATEAQPNTEGQTAQGSEGALPTEPEQQQTQQTEAEQATEGEAQTEGESKIDEPEGAPENYEFKVPEGMPEGHSLDEQVLDAYSEAARELNLTQESAQALLDKVMPRIHQRGVEAQEQQANQWAEEARKDRELGGDKLDENLSVAKKALDKFGSDGLRDLLNSPLGLGNHPEVIRFMHKVGKALSEDSFVSGSPASERVDLNDMAQTARALYGKKN